MDGNLYYKDGDDYYRIEPIKWRVISRDENNIAVLVAENILDYERYDGTQAIFSISSIRYFLNDTFASRAFTYSSRNLIKNTIIDSDAIIFNSNLQEFYAPYLFRETKLYLLGFSEINNSSIFPEDNYNNSSKRFCTSFAYISLGSDMCDSGYMWWLRSSYCAGETDSDFAYLGDGVSHQVIDRKAGVVPALSIYLPPAE